MGRSGRGVKGKQERHAPPRRRRCWGHLEPANWRRRRRRRRTRVSNARCFAIWCKWKITQVKPTLWRCVDSLHVASLPPTSQPSIRGFCCHFRRKLGLWTRHGPNINKSTVAGFYFDGARWVLQWCEAVAACQDLSSSRPHSVTRKEKAPPLQANKTQRW